MNGRLAELAKLYGVQISYKDMSGKRSPAPPESVLLALRALGAPVHSMDSVEGALRLRREELASRAVEHVLVAWDGILDTTGWKLPTRCRPTLVLEDGTEVRWPPRNLPTGYHKLILDLQGRREESLIISAPTRAHFPLPTQAWGVFAPVYALHSKRSFGAGDLTDFESLIEWMQELGGQVAATLPLLANFMDEPCEPGPYSPASRLFWNEFYVDPTRATEFSVSTEARQFMNTRPAQTRLVEYRKTMAAKRRVLEALARSFFDEGSESRIDSFNRFLRANPDVTDYANFRAVTDRLQLGWRSWPERLRHGTLHTGDYDEGVQRYHLYAQWLIQEQLAGLRQRTNERGGVLYLDLPLGLHTDSYDTWRHRDIFVSGMSTGAPPDRMFTTGQNWSLPPMHPFAMRKNQYKYTIAYIRNHLRYAGLLRIDHVMGLHRLFWIPDGLSGDKGVYVEYPAGELYAILSVESHRNKAGIVGENLGIVPPEVNASMRRHNVRQMYVAQYEITDDPTRSVLRKPAEGSVASLNTHDMAPFRAFLDGTDIPDRVDLKFLDGKEARTETRRRARLRKVLAGFLHSPASKPEKLFAGCLNFLRSSQAAVILVNLEDLWQETNPQNIPATTTERPNWRRRMRYSLSQIRKMKAAEKLLVERAS